MHFSTSVFFAALVSIVQAQTPTGFTPQVDTELQVLFNSTAVKPPGLQLTKNATARQPQIALSSNMFNSSETFIFIMLDLDVPPANGSTTRRILLHAMNTGFKATQQRVNGATLLASPEQGPAPYLPPSPPAIDTIPHRYVQLLFQQPAEFKMKASDFAGLQDRINFDVAKFIAENGAKAPIAANFFRVDGRADVANGTATTSDGVGGARETLVPTDGAAGKLDIPHIMVGLICGLVLFVL